jgi:hypothetical protein
MADKDTFYEEQVSLLHLRQSISHAEVNPEISFNGVIQIHTVEDCTKVGEVIVASD